MTRQRRVRRREASEPRPAGLRRLDADAELTPEIEAAIDRLAVAGRTDHEARNALYAVLEVKIARFLAPYQGQVTPVGEFADLRQEAFPLFADLVRDWTGEGSFARYFLAFFPWRLRHLIEAHQRRWPRNRILLLSEDGTLSDALWGDLLAECDPVAQVGPLGVADELLLYLHLVEDRPVEEIAPLLGWSRRTAFRRWRALLARLADRLGGDPAAWGRLGAAERRVS